jgi:hypothetical protein
MIRLHQVNKDLLLNLFYCNQAITVKLTKEINSAKTLTNRNPCQNQLKEKKCIKHVKIR